MSTPDIQHLGLIAGKGDYPDLIISQAKAHGIKNISLAAFHEETSPALEAKVSTTEWLRVGQLGKMLRFFKQQKVTHAIMAGQISPQRLFDLRPDLKALLILAKLKQRNAETIFGAIADELETIGVHLLPATTFLENFLASPGHIAGPKPSRNLLQEIEFGWPIVKQISALDIGQTIVVKKGTVLAVEGYDGTNATIRRGGNLGKGSCTVLKVSKPRQDMRFDVPVIGSETLRIAAESGVSAIVCESKKTLLLGLEEIRKIAQEFKITFYSKED